MALRLHIHGPAKSAKRAAARHGIPLENCRLGSMGSVICDAPCKHGVTNRVVRWHGERAHAKRGRGFPPGTLTFYSGSCPRGLGRARRRRRRR
jgi:hypothetical protein